MTAEAPLVDTTSKEVGGTSALRSSSTRRRSIAASRASSGWCRASSRRSPPQRSAATRSASAARARATSTTRWTVRTTTTGLTGGGTSSQARVPIEAVQEFKVVTSQFDAEYGGTSGAIVNAVSKRAPTSFTAAGSRSTRIRTSAPQNYFAKQSNLDGGADDAAAVRRHDRRPDRSGQDALLLQRRAHPLRQRRHGERPDAARS